MPASRRGFPVWPIIFMGLALSAESRSQPRWLQTGGPPGGNINSIVSDVSGTLYAATTDGAVYRSEDNGLRWTKAGPSRSGTARLVISGSGVLIAGLSGMGAQYSTDGGIHWTPFEDFNTGPVAGMSRAPNGYVVAGLSNNVFPMLYSNIRVFTGTGWFDAILPELPLATFSFCFPSAQQWLAGTSKGIIRSTDEGHTWQSWGGAFTDTVFSLLVSSDHRIFAGTRSRGVFVSSDSGTSWAPTGSMASSGVMALAEGQDSCLFAATLSYGIFRSSNGGSSWSGFNDGLGSLQTRALLVLSDGSLLAGTGADGVYRSTDQSNPWESRGQGIISSRVTSLATSDSTNVFATADVGLFRSSDRGDTWIRLASLSPTHRTIFRTRAGRILLGTVNGVFHSVDLGDSWTLTRVGLSDSSVFCFAEDPVGAVYAGTRKGVNRSLDGGETWSPANGGIEAMVISGLFADRSGTLFATSNSGVYRSTNQGDSWTPTATGLSATSFNTFVQDSSGNVYVSAQNSPGGGIFRSTDEGISWTRLPVPTNMESVRGMLFNRCDHLYAVWFDRLLRSTDRGETWLEAGDGASEAISAPLGFPILREDAAGYLYLSSGSTGVYRTASSSLIFVRRDSIPYEPLRVGDSLEATLVVHNPSALSTTVTAAEHGNPTFIVTAALPHSVAPGDSLVLLVAFRPASFGMALDSLRIVHSYGTAMVQLAGSSPYPTLALSVGALDFGDVTKDSVAQVSLRVRNSSINELVLDSVFTTSSHFVVDSSNARIAESLDLHLTFRPDRFGEFSDTLVIRNNSATPLRRVSLHGSSTLPRVCTVSVPNFTQLAVGDTATAVLRIFNNSANNLNLLQLRLSSFNFHAVFAGPTFLAKAETTAVDIAFTPDSMGVFFDTLRIFSEWHTASVVISGSSPLPILWRNIVFWNAGTIPVGDSASKLLLLSNFSVNPLQIDSFTIRSAAFSIAGPDPPLTVRRGDTATVRVRFNPDSVALFIDTLFIWSHGEVLPVRVGLQGRSSPSTGIPPEMAQPPTAFRLHGNYPNPFNPVTWLVCDVPKSSDVRVSLYDLAGRELQVLSTGWREPGTYRIVLNGSRLASGTYLVQMRAGEFSQTIRVLLVR